MPLIWDNPLGHDIVAVERCRTCRQEATRTFDAEPWKASEGGSLADDRKAPLTLQDGARMLDQDPFKCERCGGTGAALVSIGLDEDSRSVQ